jgi:hypothetical protein
MVEELDTSLLDALPLDLIDEIKTKFVQSLHNSYWSAWLYKKATQTLIVDVGKLYVDDNTGEQTAAILLVIDLGLVNTLTLRTCFLQSHRHNGGPRIDWIEYLKPTDYWYLEDYIDESKIQKKIVDDYTMEYLTNY